MWAVGKYKRNRYYVMPFGKYKNRTLDAILEINPSYICWLHDEKILKIEDKLLHLAREQKYFRYNYIDLDDLNYCGPDWEGDCFNIY